MGAEQSSGSGGQLRSQRDEDIPYTSFSIAKPIDGGGSCDPGENGSPGDGGGTCCSLFEFDYYYFHTANGVFSDIVAQV